MGVVRAVDASGGGRDGSWGDRTRADDLPHRMRGTQRETYALRGPMARLERWHWLPQTATPPRHVAEFGIRDRGVHWPSIVPVCRLGRLRAPGLRWRRASAYFGLLRPPWIRLGRPVQLPSYSTRGAAQDGGPSICELTMIIVDSPCGVRYVARTGISSWMICTLSTC